ncbi:MAG: hypothetical protein R6X34_17975 [Chloroflexota bacterium]
MLNVMQSVLILVFIIILQLLTYFIFLKPIIDTWGATKEEAGMALIGDELAATIVSTRAISINAPIDQVWQWIIQLGADRGGFFSYTLIEKALGYEARIAEPVPEFQDMAVGRVIPASVDASKSLIQYHFSVIAVQPGESFVIQNWGAFVLKKIDAQQTRFIVRTHGQNPPNLRSKIGDFFSMSAHYIMERRMMLGFKARAEAGAGVHLSELADNLWILGLILSGLGIVVMAFLGGDVWEVVVTAVYSTLWLLALLIIAPKPVYSLSLSVLIVVTIVSLFGL